MVVASLALVSAEERRAARTSKEREAKEEEEHRSSKDSSSSSKDRCAELFRRCRFRGQLGEQDSANRA